MLVELELSCLCELAISMGLSLKGWEQNLEKGGSCSEGSVARPDRGHKSTSEDRDIP